MQACSQLEHSRYVPLCVYAVRYSIYLVITWRAATLPPVALARVLLEDDELAERAGPPRADLVALDGLAAIAAVGEVEVGPRAGVPHARADDGAAVADLSAPAASAVLLSLGDDELLRAAGARREGLVALAVLRPQHVVVLADAGPGRAAQTEHLSEYENHGFRQEPGYSHFSVPVPSCRAPLCRTGSTCRSPRAC